MNITKKQAIEHFRKEHLPLVLDQCGSDMPAIREAWNNFTDDLYKTGYISRKQVNDWCHPAYRLWPEVLLEKYNE